MTITDAIVEKLLKLIDQGLCHGAGQNYYEGDFCVQQAVNRATTDNRHNSDNPMCVNETIRSIGISINDSFGASFDPHERARILRRFAVAELGSHGTVDGFQFNKKVAELWKQKHPGESFPMRGDSTRKIEQWADICVDALVELGSPGAQYLYMCDPDAKLKPEHAEELKKAQEAEERIKKLTQWKEFGKQPYKGRKKTVNK